MQMTALGFRPQLKSENKNLKTKIQELIDLEKIVKISTLLQAILSSKFSSVEEVVLFLNPSLKELKNPSIVKDLDEAVIFIKNSILCKEKILIFGDYDVDGSTSAALLINFLKDIEYDNFDFFIPDRVDDGYGLNDKSLQKILQKDFDLLITLDCGTSSSKQINYLLNKNKKCLVIDHHKSSDDVPSCLIVNPNRKDFFCEDFSTLCACGVLFLFLCKLTTSIRLDLDIESKAEKYEAIKLKTDILMDKNLMTKHLDLVALATVCDVMPLIGQNRILVSQGIRNINQNKCNSGIIELIKISSLETEINAYHFGFVIGPKINAGGRIGKSDLGARILSNLATKEESEEIALSLKNLNEERMSLEKEAMKFIEENNQSIEKQIKEFGFIFQFNQSWHEGIVGILSSRIKEKYQRPTFVGNLNIFEQKIKASARSVGDVDIGSIILSAVEKDLIISGGGHKMAGGLTILCSRLEEFLNFTSSLIKDKCDYYFANREFYYDFEISLSALSVNLAEEMEILEPFGNGNAKPIFKIYDANIIKYEILKEKHIKILLSNGKSSQFAICFGAVGSEIEKQLALGVKIDFFVNISINIFNNRKYLSVVIVDVVGC